MITRRRGMAAAITAAIVGLLASVSAAAPLTPQNQFEPVGFFSFCSEGQRTIANLDESGLQAESVTVTTTIFSSFDDFVLSKSSVKTAGGNAILATGFIKYRDAGKTQPEQIRCKFRTAESLSAGAWPPGSSNNTGRFVVEPIFGFGPTIGAAITTSAADQQCSDLNQETIDRVWQSLTPTQQDDSPFNPTGTATSSASPNTLVTVPDVQTVAGPQWTSDFNTVTLAGSTLEVPSKALVVPSGSAGIPRFEGAHYCTLVAPQYLADILTGLVTVS